MEAVVFCGIAGLVAFCVAGLLPGGAVASRPCGFAAGGVNQILLLTGRIFDRAPGAVDVLASLAEPFRDMGAAKRLLFGSSGESGGRCLIRGARLRWLFCSWASERSWAGWRRSLSLGR